MLTVTYNIDMGILSICLPITIGWYYVKTAAHDISLHCKLAAAQCIVIGPVCLCVGRWVCLCVCGSVTTITRNCVHRSSPNWFCR